MLKSLKNEQKIYPSIIKYNLQERKGLPSLFIRCLKEEKQLTVLKKKNLQRAWSSTEKHYT